MNNITKPHPLSVLIVENNSHMASMLIEILKQSKFNVTHAENSDKALKIIANNDNIFNLIIIDFDLPDIPGVALCTLMRTKPHTKNTPIIMLAEKSKEMENIKGLNTGVDDYLIKPFTTHDFISRVKSTFHKSKLFLNGKMIEYKDLKLDTSSYRVIKRGKDIHLGPTEFRILQCLMEYPTKVLSREHIIRHVWGYGANVDTRTIDVHINRLRKALEDSDLIRTIRSVGYCFDGPGIES